MELSKLLINRKFQNFALFITFFLTGLLLSTFLFVKPNPEKLKKDFQEAFENQSYETQTILNKLAEAKKTGRTNTIEISQAIKNKIEEEEIIILQYSKDSLVYWSENTLPFPVHFTKSFTSSPMAFIANGWYGILNSNSGKNNFVGLFRIKNEYPFENNYLHNIFSKHFKLPPNTIISVQKGDVRTFSKSGKFLCYLSENNSPVLSIPLTILFLIVWLTAFCFFWLFAFNVLKTKPPFLQNKLLLFSFLFILIFASRYLLFHFDTPWTLYSTLLFSPLYYASSIFIPSLGDLFINVFLFLFTSSIFFKNSIPGNYSRFKFPFYNYLISALLFILIIALFEFSINIYKGLVLNSNVPMNLNNIFSLNFLTLLAYSVTAILFFSFFLLSFRLLQFINLLCQNKLNLLILLLILISIFAIAFLYFDEELYTLCFFIVFIAFLYLSQSGFLKPASFISILINLVIFTSLSTFILLKYQDISEKNNRKLLAQKLLSDRDPLAEYATTDIYDGMRKDSVLLRLIANATNDEESETRTINYILNKSLKNAWSKYNIGITICGAEKMLNVVIPNNTIINCNKYFSQLITSIGQPTISDKLYYLDYGTESASYLAIFPFQFKTDSSTRILTIYLDITSKTVPKGLGYPELLVDKNLSVGPDAGIYSYAFYKKEALTRNVGKYSYALKLNTTIRNNNNFSFYNSNGYNHLEYTDSGDKILIISTKSLGISQILSPFSYLFIFYVFVLIALTFFINPSYKFVFQEANFRLRLQYAMISIILISFISVGIISWFYISRQNDIKNNDSISEKAHSILIEVQQKLADYRSIEPEMGNDLYVLLNKLSLVFFTDVNFYNTSGDLIASSRPQIFEEGLLSTKINPVAYSDLVTENRTSYIHKEKIGSYEFLSAYLPCRNQQDKVIGYLNLPYFARQAEIRNEFSSFLVAFITIYILLIVISILATIVIAKYMTSQLSLIKEKLTGLKLGKPNEKIEWRRKDEIGNLVEAYNMMIDKLVLSADQLAKSERESAWREMAKQVAHEIKNPLTPMKLSVQHLKKAWDENATDFDKRLNRFTETLVEQIDSLSTIASEFSDFAKMPQAKAEKLDIKEVILNVLELYKNNTLFEIITKLPQNSNCYVHADKKQILRVLINLIKNSIQAFVPEKKGILTLSIKTKDHQIYISVEDNGHGIQQNQHSKIFSPNFTTRTSGMGLGLAMAKTIIEENGGTIDFISTEGKGTIFTICLPSID